MTKEGVGERANTRVPGSHALTPTAFHTMRLLALHGFTGRGSDWDVLRDRIAGYPWIAPDLPGHGPSPALPADLGAHLDFINRSLDVCDGASVLLGYSMGARLALHAALDAPQCFRALVLIGGSPGLDTEAARASRRTADAALAQRIRNFPTTADFLAEWDAQPLLAGRAAMPEPWKSRSLEARRHNTLRGLAASLEGVGTGTLPSLWDRLAELDLPVLLLAGANDAKFADIAHRMAARLPDARVALVPHAGHAAHLERPDSTAAILAPWLDRMG